MSMSIIVVDISAAIIRSLMAIVSVTILSNSISRRVCTRIAHTSTTPLFMEKNYNSMTMMNTPTAVVCIASTISTILGSMGGTAAALTGIRAIMAGTILGIVAIMAGMILGIMAIMAGAILIIAAITDGVIPIIVLGTGIMEAITVAITAAIMVAGTAGEAMLGNRPRIVQTSVGLVQAPPVVHGQAPMPVTIHRLALRRYAVHQA